MSDLTKRQQEILEILKGEPSYLEQPGIGPRARGYVKRRDGPTIDVGWSTVDGLRPHLTAGQLQHGKDAPPWEGHGSWWGRLTLWVAYPPLVERVARETRERAERQAAEEAAREGAWSELLRLGSLAEALAPGLFVRPHDGATCSVVVDARALVRALGGTP